MLDKMQMHMSGCRVNMFVTPVQVLYRFYRYGIHLKCYNKISHLVFMNNS